MTSFAAFANAAGGPSRMGVALRGKLWWQRAGEARKTCWPVALDLATPTQPTWPS